MNFDTTFFRTNRQKLRAGLPDDAPLILTANGLLQRNADGWYRFRQDSNFWYLTGITEPDVVMVSRAAREFLIVPGRDAVREAFDGTVDLAGLAAISGIADIYDEAEGWQKLAALLKPAGRAHTVLPPPAYLAQHGMYANPARQRLQDRLQTAAGGKLELQDVRPQLAALRVVKQPAELAAIQKAIDITLDSLRYTADPQRLQTYRFEYEAEAELTRQFKLGGAGGHAFEPIIVAGRRACVLHNMDLNGGIGMQELLQFDVGAEYDMYAADISRTYAIGRPTQRQQAVHAAVLAVQDFALGLLKPGVLLKEYEQLVAVRIAQALTDLGVLKAPDTTAARAYYPHAASHFLGLDVHDTGPYDQPLAAGMVLTCEPGIYLPDEAIGVRIEDDILITPDGNRSLSAGLSRGLRL